MMNSVQPWCERCLWCCARCTLHTLVRVVSYPPCPVRQKQHTDLAVPTPAL